MAPAISHGVLGVVLLLASASASDLVTLDDGRLVPGAAASNSNSGHAVDIDGDILVVGAHGHPSNGGGAGAVFVYERSGGAWAEVATLVGSHTDANDAFGYALDLDGERLVVGAAWKEFGGGIRRGEAYVFERLGDGSWVQRKRLFASNGGAEDLFGYDVALDGDRIVVGAYGQESWRGSAYVFELQGGSWVETAELSPSHGGTNQLFGTSVDVDGDAIAVGAVWMDLSDPGSSDRPGAAYVFRGGGATWTEEVALAGVNARSTFFGPEWMGQSIAIQGDTLVAGSPRSRNAGGTAFVFEHSGGSWSQTAQLLSSLGGGGWMGHSVGLDGDWIVCGAPLATPRGNGTRLGAVTAFRRQSEGWSERRLLLADSMIGEGQMGYGAAIDGDEVVGGAMWEPSVPQYGGAAYTFELPASAGDAFCFGDGLGAECPCGWNNFSPGNGGCLNASHGNGLLVAEGSASLVTDDLQLVAARLPANKTALLFHGTTELAGGLGLTFGNGLRCVGGAVVRAGVRVADASGNASWGPALGSGEGFAPGETGRFQVWYRDPNHYCDGEFNLTNAYRVDFE